MSQLSRARGMCFIIQPKQVFNPIPGGNDATNYHCPNISVQGKSSSVAQGEEVCESFQSKGSQFHGHHSPYNLQLKLDPNVQQYNQLNANAQSPHREWPSDQLGQDFAAAQYVDQPGMSYHVPAQQDFAAVTTPPGSNAPVQINPNLMVGSRIQIPTQSATKYGVIRWIGQVPAIQGLVAGIEMVCNTMQFN